jgi:hypothetical protein
VVIPRRTFLGLAAAAPLAWAAPKDCPPPPRRASTRLRPNASALASADWSQIRSAYESWRRNDNILWRNQMLMHRDACTGSANHIDVHSSWSFLAWHRGFIYFHERILGKRFSKQGMDFRLPAWDWETSPAVPGIFQSVVTMNTPLRTTGNHHREVVMQGLARCNVMAWLLSNTSADFYGSGPCNAGSGPLGPHQAVHLQIGGDFGFAATAANDPLFFLHHANVDRMWWWWRRNYECLGPEFAPPPGWQDQAFQFCDENGKTVSIKAGALLEEEQLGYTYEPVQGLYQLTKAACFGVDVSAQGILKFPQQLVDRLSDLLRGLVHALPASLLDLPRIPQLAGKALAGVEQTAERMMSLSGTIPLSGLQPFTYYAIGIAAVDTPQAPSPDAVVPIGGIGDFTGHAAHEGRWPASLCFEPDTLVRFLLTSEDLFAAALYYSPMDLNGELTHWKRITGPEFKLEVRIPKDWLP